MIISSNTGLKCWPCRGRAPSCHYQAFSCTRFGISIKLVKIWREIKKKWQNILWSDTNQSVYFTSKTYIVPVNPIIIVFCHQQHRICSFKQNLFGWFTYNSFLTATFWINRPVGWNPRQAKPFINFLWAVYLWLSIAPGDYLYICTYIFNQGARFNHYNCSVIYACMHLGIICK